MEEYNIEITEILQKRVKVSAESEEEAISKVYEKYYNCEVILEPKDLVHTEFKRVTE